MIKMGICENGNTQVACDKKERYSVNLFMYVAFLDEYITAAAVEKDGLYKRGNLSCSEPTICNVIEPNEGSISISERLFFFKDFSILYHQTKSNSECKVIVNYLKLNEAFEEIKKNDPEFYSRYIRDITI